MPLNPTGSEIPRSLTQVTTTIDAALNLKVDSAAYQNAGGIDAGIWKEQLDLTGVNTGDQDLSSYATTSAVAAGYQPLDSDLTAIAALTTTSTGRALLTESTAQTGTGALVRAASPTLTGTVSASSIRNAGGNNEYNLNSGRLFNNTSNEFTLCEGTILGFSTSRSVAPDTRIVRSSAGVLQVGTTANNTAGSVELTNLTASGTLRVGGGTVVANILSATATLDFPSIGSNGTETLTITVTGAVAGDSVFLGCPAGLDAGLVFCASVTAADTVTVRMHNSSGGSVDPASGTFRATVIRF